VPLGERAEGIDVTRLDAAPALVLERRNAHAVEVARQRARVVHHLVARDLAELGAHQADRAAAVEDAGRRALVVLDDLHVRRIGGFRVDAERLQRRAVDEDADVKQLEHDRIVGRDGVELLAGEGTLVVGELLFRPAAQHRNPFAWFGCADFVRDVLEGLLARGDAVETDLAVPVFRGTHVVRVIVDQPGNDSAAGEFLDPRRWPLEAGDLLIAADRDDAFAAQRERLRDGEAVVDRDDAAVDQHHVGGLCGGKRAGDRQQEHGEQVSYLMSGETAHGFPRQWRAASPKLSRFAVCDGRRSAQRLGPLDLDLDEGDRMR
jgi:hypothetical protein